MNIRALVLLFLALPPASALAAGDGRSRTNNAVSIVRPTVDPAHVFDIQERARPPGPDDVPPARAYATAKKLLARGKAAQALKALGNGSPNSLLEDRESLLRADALLAIGSVRLAEQQYLRAVQTAQVQSVKLAGVRGLANVYAQTHEYEQQRLYVEALLSQRGIPRRGPLMLEHATVLARLDRKEEAAKEAWKVMLDYPSKTASKDAKALLESLEKRGAKVPSMTAKFELVRIQNLIREHSYAQASKALDKLADKNPTMSRQIMLARANILEGQGKKAELVDLLKKLLAEAPEKNDNAKILERLGKLAMNANDNAQAMAYFDELAQRFPKSRRAPKAQYLAAWLPYNAGDYPVAAERFLDFARGYRKAPERPEALWYAGWAAYLANNDALAQRTFAQLIEEHPGSEMVLFAEYWIGRIKERNKDVDGAKVAYRDVLKSAPLSYFAQWAIVRLGALGEETVLNAPPAEGTKPATVNETLALLGPARPIQVDRAVALRRADLPQEAVEELEAASNSLAKIRDTRGRVMVAEMVDALGDHHQAFQLATAITQDGGDLVSGKPYAWRAWRLAYPKAFWDDVELAAKTHKVDPRLVLAVMRTESRFQPEAQSGVGAKGLMQLLPSTAKQIGRSVVGGKAHAARMTRPASNIWLGAWYIKKLVDRYNGQIALAIGAYNAGPTAMDRWVAAAATAKTPLDSFVESVSYRETRRYIRRVLETYFIYKRLDSDAAFDLAMVVEPRPPPRDAVAF